MESHEVIQEEDIELEKGVKNVKRKDLPKQAKGRGKE